VQDRNIKAASLVSWPTSVLLLLESTASQVRVLKWDMACHISHYVSFTDKPTTKFGDALRAQVEERLNFFETGTAPAKNSEAMQKVLESLRLEDESDDEELPKVNLTGLANLTTLEVTPIKSKKEKKKEKKRKSDAMEVILRTSFGKRGY
jgi:hypothetical protein